MPSGSGLPRALPEPAMTETNNGFGTFSDHSELFSSGPRIGPLTDTPAFSGGDILGVEATSSTSETETNANGRTTFPAARMMDAKRESTLSDSEPPKRISNR